LTKFGKELRDLLVRYAVAGGTTHADRRHDESNEWATPWRISSSCADAFHLTTMLFAHPANADPTYKEYCSASESDRYFGAQFDAFDMIQKDQDLMAWANPPYDEDVMSRFWQAIERRVQDETHAFRIVLALPFDSGKSNSQALKRLQGKGIDASVVFEGDRFMFWRPQFWRTRDYGSGTANFRVGFVLVQNCAAKRDYPCCPTCCRNLSKDMEAVQWRGSRQLITSIDDAYCAHRLTRDMLKKMALELWERMTVEGAQQRLHSCCGATVWHYGSCEIAVCCGIISAETQKEMDRMSLKTMRLMGGWRIREWRLQMMNSDPQEAMEELVDADGQLRDRQRRLLVRFAEGERMTFCVRLGFLFSLPLPPSLPTSSGLLHPLVPGAFLPPPPVRSSSLCSGLLSPLDSG